MNPTVKFNKEQLELIEKIEHIENREYKPEELKLLARKIEEYIMAESKDNISNILNQYRDIISILEK